MRRPVKVGRAPLIRDPITDREFRSHVHVVRTHVQLQCGFLKTGIANSMPGNNGEHFTKTICSKLYKQNRKICIVEFDHMGMFLSSFYVETITRKIHKLHNILSLWFADMRITVSTFRNAYVNEADHVTGYDLNSELKMAVKVMTWFFARNHPRYRAI